MKHREERRKVLVRARMRVGAAWSDVAILNISSRGLGLQAAAPPPAGTYVEIRRGSHVIVARIVWSDQHRFGVRAQDVLAAEAIVAEPTNDSHARENPATRPTVDRRAAPRLETRHEHSRLLARSMEFASLALVAGAAAVTLQGLFASAVSAPASVVTEALRLSR